MKQFKDSEGQSLDAIQTQAFVRSACLAYRDQGGRKLALSADGITLTDASGQSRSLTVDGEAVAFEPKVLADVLQRYRVGFAGSADELEIVGDVYLKTEIEGVVTLRAKKTRMPALETIATFDPEQLAILRKTYRHHGVDIYVQCEGETRARDLAIAFANERSLLGLASETSIKWQDRPYWAHENIEFPRVVFDDTRRDPSWNIDLIGKRAELFNDAHRLDTSMVRISYGSRGYSSVGPGHQDGVDKKKRPTAYIQVDLANSKPVARMVLSKSMVDLVAQDATFEDAPWTDVVRRREAASQRERPEKTWHSTTEQVALAYLDRRAPRGYVSGKSLYFHGPIAYSGSDKNPIAAFVDVKGRKPVLFIGRGYWGEGDGVTSMAQGDITNHVRDRFEVVHVDDLAEILSFGGSNLNEVARQMRSKKDEAERPSFCVVERDKTKAWLQRRIDAAEMEVVGAAKVKYATWRKADSFGALLRIEAIRERLNETFKLRLPGMLDVDDITAKYEAARKAAFDRQDDIRRRKEEGRAAPST